MGEQTQAAGEKLTVYCDNCRGVQPFGSFAHEDTGSALGLKVLWLGLVCQRCLCVVPATTKMLVAPGQWDHSEEEKRQNAVVVGGGVTDPAPIPAVVLERACAHLFEQASRVPREGNSDYLAGWGKAIMVLGEYARQMGEG